MTTTTTTTAVATTATPPTPASDSWALVAAAQAGDRDAFAQLYTRYQPGVRGFLRGRLHGDHHLAEDLCSETFLRALRRLDTVSDQGKDPGAWLTTIARNLVTDHYKSARSRLDTTTDQVPEPGRTGDPVLDETSDRVLNRQTRDTVKEVVSRASDSLTAAQQEALAGYLREEPAAQTAARMGRRVDAVKGLRYRALQAVKRNLAAQGLTTVTHCEETRQCDQALGRARAAVERARDTGHTQRTAGGPTRHSTTGVQAAARGDDGHSAGRSVIEETSRTSAELVAVDGFINFEEVADAAR